MASTIWRSSAVPVPPPPDAEPRVLAADVRAQLQRALDQAEHLLLKEAVEVIAERAGVSPSTVYRVLSPTHHRKWLPLDLGDRLLLAAGGHLHDARIEGEDDA